MECGSIYDDYCMTNVLVKDEKITSTSEVFDSLWVPNSSPSFHDSASMVNFENIQEENNTESSFFSPKMGNFNGEIDEYLHQPAKKRRLSPDQVKFLEKTFEVESKLEPQRKLELANELGLQPRQIAIWFQNRRARCKTKILEKEYDTLKASYDRLEADYETLCKENDEMKNEVKFLTEKLFMRKNENQFDPINSNRKSNFSSNIETCKQEDAASSAKSDVFDSNDSPNHEYTDGNHSALLDSSHVFESDYSQDEDDRIFTKVEDECFDDLQPNSCDLGFPVEDQGTWLWQ